MVFNDYISNVVICKGKKMIKNILIDSIEYNVGSLKVGFDNRNIEVSGTVELKEVNESSIDFTMIYNKTELTYFFVNDIEILDLEDIDMSEDSFIDFIYDSLPIEDIEKEVSENYEVFLQEEKDNIEYLRLNDPSEYICVMKNDFGGFLYE